MKKRKKGKIYIHNVRAFLGLTLVLQLKRNGLAGCGSNSPAIHVRAPVGPNNTTVRWPRSLTHHPHWLAISLLATRWAPRFTLQPSPSEKCRVWPHRIVHHLLNFLHFLLLLSNFHVFQYRVWRWTRESVPHAARRCTPPSASQWDPRTRRTTTTTPASSASSPDAPGNSPSEATSTPGER